MKDIPLYEVTKVTNLRDVIKTRVKEFPGNPVFFHKPGMIAERIIKNA